MSLDSVGKRAENIDHELSLEKEAQGHILATLADWVRTRGKRPVLILATSTGLAVLGACGKNNGDAKELHCLAENIFYEATLAKEPIAGQRAVGFVTLARKISGKFPNTICGVVWQPAQFSWTLIHPEKRAAFIGPRADFAKKVAADLYPQFDSRDGVSKLALELGLTFDTHYYKRTDNKGVTPRGGRIFKRLDTVGSLSGSAHTFYRDPGKQRPIRRKNFPQK